MTKHTPGPWVYSDEYYPHIQTESGEALAKTDCSTTRKEWVDDPKVCLANAHLIAAAPDLLASLCDVLSVARIKWGNLDPDANKVFADAEAAIAKAKGE